LGGVGAAADNLGGDHAGGGEVHFILHGSKKDMGFLLAFPIIAGQGEYLADTLIHPSLAGPNLTDAGQ